MLNVHKTKKKRGLLSAIFFGLLVLSACSSDSDSADGAGGKVELIMWAWPGFGLEELIKEYEEDNPDIDINLQEADYGDVHTNLVTALAAGSGAPDISAVDEGYLDRIKENSQHFHNLYDYGAADIQKDYLDWKWKQANNNEEDFLFGVPTDVGPMVMAYREDLFEAAGLPVTPEEVAAEIDTWEAFIEAGKKMQESTGVHMINRTTDLYQAIRGQYEYQYFDEENNFIGDESEGHLRAWELASNAGDISMNVERDTSEWGAALAKGDIATVLLPPWMLQNVKNAAPDTSGLWNVTFMPEGSGNFGGSFLTLPEQGEHPEEAYAFITWVMAPEQQLRIFENSGPFPSTPGVYGEQSIQEIQDDFFNNTELGQYYAEAALQVVAGYKGTMHDPVSQVFQDALISIEDGNASPEKAWETGLEEAERQLGRQ